MAICNKYIDCKTSICPRSKRCRSCDGKHRWAQSDYRKELTAKIKQTCNIPKVRAKRSVVARAWWSDPINKAKMSASIIAAWSNPKKRRNMLEGLAKRERYRTSSIELIVKEFLEANFEEVIWQYVPDEYGSPGVYDFYIPAIDTIVEVDAQYWHNLDDVQRRDAEKEEWALEHEYGFIRITEDEAKSPEYLISLLKEMRMY